MAPDLDEHLHRCFGRPNKTEAGPCFKIDDRGDGDISPDFCAISLTVTAGPDEEMILELHRPPLNVTVRELVEDRDGKITASGDHIQLHVRPNDAPVIRKLAKAIKGVIGRGERYANSNWMWVARRTEDALGRLAACLAEYWRQQKKPKRRYSNQRREPLVHRPTTSP